MRFALKCGKQLIAKYNILLKSNRERESESERERESEKNISISVNS